MANTLDDPLVFRMAGQRSSVFSGSHFYLFGLVIGIYIQLYLLHDAYLM